MAIVSYYYRTIKYPVLTDDCQLVTNEQLRSNPRRTFIAHSAIPAISG
jgi:hypothetical protein